MVVQKILYTVDEFEQFIAQPENSDKRFELIYGEIVEKMPTEEHGLIVLNFGAAILAWVKPRKLGRVGVEIRHRKPPDRYNDRIPDIAYTSSERAGELVKQGAVPRMPDLAIAIKSPDDNPRELREKAAYYLQNGSRLVWLGYPDEKIVEACSLGEDGEMEIQIYGEDDVLNGGGVLPGFEIRVKDIFDI